MYIPTRVHTCEALYSIQCIHAYINTCLCCLVIVTHLRVWLDICYLHSSLYACIIFFKQFVYLML